MANREHGWQGGRVAGSGISSLLLLHCPWSKKKKRDSMLERFVTIWFPHLKTDWFSLRKSVPYHQPFVLALPDHGRMVITAANAAAKAQGVDAGMVVADARA